MSEPRGQLRPCGTRAAYQRHLRVREVPCDPCAEANRLRNALNTTRRALINDYLTELIAALHQAFTTPPDSEGGTK